MIRNWRFYAVLLIAALSGAGIYRLVTGSGPADVAEQHAVPTASQAAEACTSPTHAPALDPEGEQRAAMIYMRSPQRVQRYQQMWGAAEKVARALYAGEFGPVTKYDDWKNDLVPGYTGWGGMQSLDHQYYAWVWWNADGTIDYSKGVQGFAVLGLHVESLDLGNGPFTSFIPRGSCIDVVDVADIGQSAPYIYG